MMCFRLSMFMIISLFLLTACFNSKKEILKGGDPLPLRNMQSRVFESNDRVLVLRNIIATLQDLGFVLDKADADLGTVTATKLSGYEVRMTVTVREKSKSQTLVRASAHYNLRSVEDPVIYQGFFSALGKSMFLTAHDID